MIVESLLEAAVARYGLDSVETLIQKVLPEAPEPTVQSMRDAIDQAAESFHEKYGDKYGGPNNSFLVRKQNVETILRSTLPGEVSLSGKDLSGKGFKGATEAPVEVREESVGLLHEKMKKDRRLAEILERQRQREVADRRWKKLRDELETIREATEEEEWFGHSVEKGPRSNYLRYLHQVAGGFEERAGTVTLDVVPGQKDVVPAQEKDWRVVDSEPNGSDRRKLTKTLEDPGALLLTGPPGSGKSHMIEQLLWKRAVEAAAGPIAKEGFLEGQSPVPVYVTPGRGDVFERIAHALHIGGLGDRPFSEEWIREGLQRGVLFVALDDANRFSREELRDLLDYRDSSQVVLLSRDHSRIPKAGPQHYQVAPLTKEQAKAVLRPKLGGGAEAFFYRTQKDGRLRTLASRPQTLLILSSVRTENSWIPDDRFGLYDRAFRARHENEEPGGNPIDEKWFKRRVLGALALDTVKLDESYSIPLPEARRSITRLLQAFEEEGYGIDSISTTAIIGRLRGLGHLTGSGETLRFEHDRWLEFFAACELVEREDSLGSVANGEARREIAFFAGALSTIESEHLIQPVFWADFWKQVTTSDPFWALACRRQQDAHYRHKDEIPSAQDLAKVRDELPDPSEAAIRESFGKYAEIYQQLRDTHFPRMKEVVPPHTEGRVGVLVERGLREDGLPGGGYVYGIVGVEPDAPRARLVDKLEYTYTDDGKAIPSTIRSSSADPAQGTPPAVVAVKRLKGALEKAINEDKLWEPTPLLRERAYFEALALYRSNVDSSLTSTPLSIDADWLQRVLQESTWVKKGKLDPSDRAGRRRKVSHSEWTRMLQEARQRGIPTQPLRPPISPPWTVMPKCDGKSLTDEEIEDLTEWSVKYYELLYRMLFELVSKGFPTTKQRFRCFEDTFPVLIVLALGDRDEGNVWRPKNERSRAQLGQVWTIQRRDTPEESVEVISVESESKARQLAEARGMTGGWRTVWSMRFRPTIPPLQHGVYRIIGRDLEKLLQGERSRL